VYNRKNPKEAEMKNISNGERIIRLVIGAAVIGWGLWARNWWGAIGLLPLLTGIIGWCGLYQILGTCCPFFKNKDSKKDDKSKSCGCCGGK
jgi:hypothetical protein